MLNDQTVHYAVLCLRELDGQEARYVPAPSISRQQGIPLEDCRRVLLMLHAAGIVAASAEGFMLARPLEAVTAWDIIQAIAQPVREAPRFGMLYQADPDALPQTLEAVRLAHAWDAFPSDGPRVGRV